MDNLYTLINASPYDSMDDIENKYRYALSSETDSSKKVKIIHAGRTLTNYHSRRKYDNLIEKKMFKFPRMDFSFPLQIENSLKGQKYQHKQYKKNSTMINGEILTKVETVERNNSNENKTVSYYRTDKQGKKIYITEDQYRALTSEHKRLI
jgi:hypothetical protein